MALDYLPSAILMPTHGAQSLPVTMTVMIAPAKHAALISLALWGTVATLTLAGPP
jgi:hypothetical protein